MNTNIIGDAEGDPLYYNHGWTVSESGELITHNVSNPNDSSNILIYPKRDFAVVVLSNINGSHIGYIPANINLNSLGKEMIEPVAMNSVEESMYTIGCIVVCAFFIMTVSRFLNIKKHMIKLVAKGKKIDKKVTIIKSLVTGILSITFVLLPYIAGFNYLMLIVWMPLSLFIFLILAAILFLIMTIRSIIILKKLCFIIESLSCA